MKTYLIIIAVGFICCGMFGLYVYSQLWKFRKRDKEIGEAADSIMAWYLKEGKDQYYAELGDNELITMYKESLNVEMETDIELNARAGVEGKLMEDELSKRGFDIMKIYQEA